MATVTNIKNSKNRKKKVHRSNPSRNSQPQPRVDITADDIKGMRRSKLSALEIRNFPVKGTTGIVYGTPFSVREISLVMDQNDQRTMPEKLARCVTDNIFDKDGNHLMPYEDWLETDMETLEKIANAATSYIRVGNSGNA